MPASCFSPTFAFDPWFLRYSPTSVHVMPAAPSFPDAPSCTISWNACDLVPDLGATAYEFISDQGAVFYDAISEPPPPEPPPPPDFVSAVLSDHDPSSIVSFLGSSTLATKPCITAPLRVARRLCVRQSAFAFVHSITDLGCFPSLSSCDAPLIVDCGASVFISSERSDFITYRHSSLQITGLGKRNQVSGEGMIRWHVQDRSGRPLELRVPGYHVPGCGVRLLPPQALTQLLGGTWGERSNGSGVLIKLSSGKSLFAPYAQRSRLPVLPMLSSALTAYLTTSRGIHDAFTTTPSDLAAFASESDVLHPSNTNLTASQKELLLWHHRLSHATLRWVRLLLRPRRYLSTLDNEAALHEGPYLPVSNDFIPREASISHVKCAACLASKAHVHGPATRPKLSSPELKAIYDKFFRGLRGERMVLKAGDLSPGDYISADHFHSPVHGRLPNSYGSEKLGYTCGTLFADHSSGHLFVYPQFSTDAPETIDSKHHLEKLARTDGFSIKRYHSDNGTFASTAFKSDCDAQSQKYDFSAPHAKFQNGVAERNIKTAVQWARANLLHLAIHWPARATPKLWPFAIKYAVWVFNRLPNINSGVSPIELWTGNRLAHADLARTHAFGCPVYVLDNDIADGKSIPKWHPRARLGMFMGFSEFHSSLVPLVLNVRTGKITPCYHAIFDDSFSTVTSLSDSDDLPSAWHNILQLNASTSFLDLDDFIDDSGKHNLKAVPALDPVWSPSPEEETVLPGEAPSTRPRRSCATYVPVSQAPGEVPSARPRRACATYEPACAYMADNPLSSSATWAQAPASVANIPHHKRASLSSPKSVTKASLVNCPLLQESWLAIRHSYHRLSAYVTRDLYDNNVPCSFDPRVLYAKRADTVSSTACANWWEDWTDDSQLSPSCNNSVYPVTHPPPSSRAFKAFAAIRHGQPPTSDPDAPTYTQAMSSTNQCDWFNAMNLEVQTLENDLKAWTVVDRQPWMRVLPSKWVFKIKRLPSGIAQKFKARFVVRGDRQREGINFFETWAPVVQWSTVRLMMVLAAKLRLHSAQCDITAAFVHSPLPPEEEIYVHQPRGFERGTNCVLRLNTSVYGLKQASRHFFHYLTERLKRQGLEPSSCDPCLFLSSKIIVVVYVDNLLIWSADESSLATLVHNLQHDDLQLRREDTAEGFLGVDIARNGNKTTLSQPGLIKKIVDACGISQEYSTSIKTPAESSPLPKDPDGPPASGLLNYASIVGMLLYVSGHTRPDIAFAVHQCARHSFNPKRSHENALKRIAKYLNGTTHKGLILDPDDSYRLDCYPDSDFAGLWGHERPDDPHCARSRSGYVITLANCPVQWRSRLNNLISLSTMEAEYVALSSACKDLFPIIDILEEITTALGLTSSDSANIHARIHEDNAGALALAKLEPARMTPRSKHYALRYHWFRQQLSPHGPRKIELLKIDTRSQLGDIFTKGLPRPLFEELRNKLMGW